MIADSLSQWGAELSRMMRLRGFWRRRTLFYRDLASALEERELPNDFVAGELAIALAPATQDAERAKGLVIMRDVMHSSDLSLHQVLVAAMPRADAIALGTLRFAQSMPKALRELALNIDQQTEMTRMVRSALVSPLILLPVAYAFAYVLSSVSIPEFSKQAPPEVWTPFNATVRGAAALFEQWGPWLALTLVGILLWVFSWALAHWCAAWRFKMEGSQGASRLAWLMVFPFQPVFALYRDIHGTRMLANLAHLLQSGMLLQDAVGTLVEGAQPWMRRHLAMIREHLQLAPGDHVGAFSHGVLSPFLLSRLSSMVRRDAGGQFDKVLIQLGTTGMEEARQAVKTRAVQINAALLVLTFGVITFFYAGQNSIAYAIQDANSPAAVMRRQAQKRQAGVQVQLDSPSPDATRPP